jgi:hypothetical protein
MCNLISGMSREWMNRFLFTLTMATAMFVEMLDNSQQKKQLIPESRRYTLIETVEQFI